MLLKRILAVLILLALCASAHAQLQIKSQPKKMRDGDSATFAVSLKEPNRLIVKNDKIKAMRFEKGRIVLDTKEQQASEDIYFKVVPKPDSLTVTGFVETVAGHTYRVTFTIRNMPGATVVINNPDNAKTKRHAGAWERKHSSTTLAAIELIRAHFTSETGAPMGYSHFPIDKQIPINPALQPKTNKLLVESVHIGNQLMLEVMKYFNHGDAEIEIHERYFDDTDVLAVEIDNKTLVDGQYQYLFSGENKGFVLPANTAVKVLRVRKND